MANNFGRKPSKPVRNGGRRRPSATISTDVASTGAARGAGSQFLGETLSPKGTGKSVDFGGGLPKARPAKVALTPEEIEARAREKYRANRRRSSANNVTGYVTPGMNTQRGPLPSAQELLEMGDEDRAITRSALGDRMPTAEELLHLTSEQAYPDEALNEGTYMFPQVSPTKTINPQRPRTLESGYERNTFGPGLGTLRVRFRDGTPWEYYRVPPDVWQRFKRVKSPGRFINRVLNGYEYGRGDF